MSNATQRYPVMDPTGMVRLWIESGRGARAWPCQDIGSDRPDMLTPGDVRTPPDWRYTYASSRLLGPDDVVYFGKVPQARGTWTDTPAGWRAAERMARNMEREYPDNDATGAPLRMIYRYTVARITMESAERDHEGRPYHVAYLVGVWQWSALLGPREAEGADG